MDVHAPVKISGHFESRSICISQLHSTDGRAENIQRGCEKEMEKNLRGGVLRYSFVDLLNAFLRFVDTIRLAARLIEVLISFPKVWETPRNVSTLCLESRMAVTMGSLNLFKNLSKRKEKKKTEAQVQKCANTRAVCLEVHSLLAHQSSSEPQFWEF